MQPAPLLRVAMAKDVRDVADCLDRMIDTVDPDRADESGLRCGHDLARREHLALPRRCAHRPERALHAAPGKVPRRLPDVSGKPVRPDAERRTGQPVGTRVDDWLGAEPYDGR